MTPANFGSAAMYQEVILDHFRHPKNKGALDKPDAHARDINTSCGDELSFTLKIGKADDKDHGKGKTGSSTGIIDSVKFDGSGCAISQAAADMLAERLKGMPLDKAMAFDKEEMLTLLGVPISGARLKCALLGLKVVKMAIIEKEGCTSQQMPSTACQRCGGSCGSNSCPSRAE